MNHDEQTMQFMHEVMSLIHEVRPKTNINMCELLIVHQIIHL